MYVAGNLLITIMWIPRLQDIGFNEIADVKTKITTRSNNFFTQIFIVNKVKN